MTHSERLGRIAKIMDTILDAYDSIQEIMDEELEQYDPIKDTAVKASELLTDLEEAKDALTLARTKLDAAASVQNDADGILRKRYMVVTYYKGERGVRFYDSYDEARQYLIDAECGANATVDMYEMDYHNKAYRLI